jgi:hypothetical protein
MMDFKVNFFRDASIMLNPSPLSFFMSSMSGFGPKIMMVTRR